MDGSHPLQLHGSRSGEIVASSCRSNSERPKSSPLSGDSAKLRQTAEFAEAFHFCTGGHGAVLLHHGAHLQVLLDDRVDVLHGRAAALGDALAAFAVNYVLVAAPLVCHRADYVR